jgi:hypothetical protein
MGSAGTTRRTATGPPANPRDVSARAGVPLDALLRALVADITAAVSVAPVCAVVRSTRYLLDRVQTVLRTQSEHHQALLNAIKEEAAQRAPERIITRELLVEFLRNRGIVSDRFGGSTGGDIVVRWNHSHGIRGDYSHSHTASHSHRVIA